MGSSPHSTKTLSTTTAISGASTSPRIPGTVSKPKSDPVQDQATVWPCGNTLLSSSGGSTIQASPVSVILPPELGRGLNCVARYLNDLWIFDTQEYTWKQVEFRENDLRPSYVPPFTLFLQTTQLVLRPRSGFSFLPCTEGILLHGTFPPLSPERQAE